MKRNREQTEKPPLELIEEATHLLRRAPASALAAYYLGTLPFALALLYFWSDMARSAFAHERLAAGTLGLSALFLWMKCWHAVFAAELHADLCGSAPPQWTLRWLLRTGLYQAILQPAGLFILPVSLLLLAPMGWTYAFFANATLFSGRQPPDVLTVVRKSWQQARLWPMQSQFLIFLFKLFGLFVFLNFLTLVMSVPFALKTLLGIETVFSQSPAAAFNTTLLAGVMMLTFLSVDPLLKAAYVLRCFYGESLQTGEDLKAGLRSFTATAKAAAAALLLVAALTAASPAAGAEAGAEAAQSGRQASASPTLASQELNRSIDEVIQQREYSWRLPRETAPSKAADAGKKNVLELFFDQIEKSLKAAGSWMKDLIDWVFRQRGPVRGPSLDGLSFEGVMRGLALLLILAIAGLIVWLLFRLWRSQSRTELVDAEILPPTPDVSDENVGAEHLPEDGWISLARDLLNRGDLRLALRAFYLATLAHMAERGWITLARFKSNRDYEHEIRRRGHALADVPALFAENVAVFERVWYGLHSVTPDQVRQFAANVERMKGGA